MAHRGFMNLLALAVTFFSAVTSYIAFTIGLAAAFAIFFALTFASTLTFIVFAHRNSFVKHFVNFYLEHLHGNRLKIKKPVS